MLSSSFAQTVNEYGIERECLNLRSHLLSLPGFALYSDLLDLRRHPVACIRELFSLGIPLCHLFNLLPPKLYYPIELDFTLRDDEYVQRLAIAQFALRARQTFGCEHFSVNDVLNPELSSGFSKALNALSVVLEKLNLIENLGSTEQLLTKQAPNRENKYLDTVHELLRSEKSFVANMELLERFTEVLAAEGILDLESLSSVFPKKMFMFARKFRIQLECIAQLPWQEQRWGAPFIMHAMDIKVNLRIHCVNLIQVKPALVELHIGSLQIPGFNVSSPESVEDLLSVPWKHLLDYHNVLNELMPISSPRHRNELILAITCVRRITDTVQDAQNKAMSDQVLEALKMRITDWRGLDSSNLGQVVLEGSLLTRRNGILQMFNVFLFENQLLLCDETLPPPSSSRISKRKVSSASIPPSKNNALYIKDHFHIRNHISSVSIGQEFERVQDDGTRIFFELALSTESYTLSLLYLDQSDRRIWHNEIQRVRQSDRPDLYNELRQLQDDAKEEIGMPHNPSEVKEGLPLPFSVESISAQRKPVSRTYNGTLTDLESGPIPQTLIAQLTPNRRSVFVKLHFGGNTFVLSIALPVRFDELMERIDKKLQYSRGWSREGSMIALTKADGRIVSIGPDTPLESVFREGTLVSLNIR